MSLLVWLPLNGDVRNQGLLGDLKFTVGSNATVNDNGKIGKCYSFSGTSGNGIYGPTQKFTQNIASTSLSIAAWVKINDNTSTYPIVLIDYGIRFQFGQTCQFRLSGTSIQVEYPFSNVAANTWYHFVGTYDRQAGIMKLYIDGVEKASRSVSAYTPNSDWARGIAIGRDHNNTNTTSYCQGSINDVRIYDHALSPMEVKELAKGLVCHYTLASNSLGPLITENLANTTGFTQWGDSNTLNTNDTSYTNAPGATVFSQTKNSGTSTCGIYVGANTSITNGHTYLVSTFVHYTGNDTYTQVYFRKNNSGGSFGKLSYCGNDNPATWPQNQWLYISLVFTATEDCSTARICTYTSVNGAKKAFTNWQVKEIISDTAYDSSGYLNNCSVISGGQLTISSDTPRYDSCCEFNGSTRISCTSPTAEAKTLSLWAYVPNPITAGVAFADYKSELAFGFTSAGIMIICCRNSRKYVPALTTNQLGKWHHFCVIKDATTSNQNDLYIDGTYVSPSNSTSNFGHGLLSNVETLMIGGRESSSNGPTYYTGKISDVRLYATALTAADVTDLYNMGCLVSQ